VGAGQIEAQNNQVGILGPKKNPLSVDLVKTYCATGTCTDEQVKLLVQVQNQMNEASGNNAMIVAGGVTAAAMVAAVPALAGLAPDALALALANPAAAVNAGIITVETAAAIATDSMTPGLAIEGLVQKAGNAANNAVKQADLEVLAANGVKFTLQNVVATGTTPSGQIVFLETGSSSAGLQHIIEEHGAEFANMGVSPAQIADVVMQAVTQGKIVGYQGSGTGRPIYEVTVNGQQHQIAVTVGSNGFIVGANPRGSVK
jgi:hypothetical protein